MRQYAQAAYTAIMLPPSLVCASDALGIYIAHCKRYHRSNPLLHVCRFQKHVGYVVELALDRCGIAVSSSKNGSNPKEKGLPDFMWLMDQLDEDVSFCGGEGKVWLGGMAPGGSLWRHANLAHVSETHTQHVMLLSASTATIAGHYNHVALEWLP
jgi:hypothetical protein